MSKNKQSLQILNRLIAQLEANTGAEALLPQEKVQDSSHKELVKEIKTQVKKTESNQVKTQEKQQAPKKQAATQEIQQAPKKQAATQEKQQAKKKQAATQEKQQAPKKQGAKKKKEEGAKQAKKKQGDKPKLPEGADEDVLIFSDVDLRVSQIVQCWKHPESTYLYCQKILVGKELRNIASGLQECISIENMKGKVIVMANLKPRMLGGFESNGMVVCSSDQEMKFFELLRPQGPLGERLYLQGYEYLFEGGEEVRPIMKKKTLERCLEHFATDKDGFVVWKGIKVRTKAGYVRSAIVEGKVS